MYRLLHDELAWWTERYRVYSRLRRQRDRAAETLRAHQSAYARHTVEVEQGAEALARREQFPWLRVLAPLRGRWVASVNEERASTQAAAARLVLLEQATSSARAEVERLDRELTAHGDVGAGYRRALETKARTLAAASDAHGRRVVELIESLRRAQTTLRDLAAARASGFQASDSLDALYQRVSRGRKRGQRDVVAASVRRAQEDLRALLHSLAALHELGPSHREAVMSFSDTFFERLVEQWAADAKGEGPRQTVRRVQQRVDAILARIDEGRQRIEQEQVHLWARFVETVRAG